MMSWAGGWTGGCTKIGRVRPGRFPPSWLHLTPGVVTTFVGYVYERAGRVSRPRAQSDRLDERVVGRDRHPGGGKAAEWGRWIIDNSGGADVPAPSEDSQDLLLALDDAAGLEQSLGRYLWQIWPLGEDRGRSRRPPQADRELNPASTAGQREHEHGDAEHRTEHRPEHPHQIEDADLEVHAHDPREYGRG